MKLNIFTKLIIIGDGNNPLSVVPELGPHLLDFLLPVLYRFLVYLLKVLLEGDLFLCAPTLALVIFAEDCFYFFFEEVLHVRSCFLGFVHRADVK